MDWTDAQREAIKTRGSRVLVSAGAGSGKTRVLVERFLQLLEENSDWQVSDIVAVTFTEKAAREMVSRIRREIRSRIERSETAQERRRWREHRNALDSARIGTIHSLCSSILRAHPAEAELDPAFEVIEEIEAAALLDRAIEESLYELSREQRDSQRGWQPGPSSENFSLSEIGVFAYLSANDVKRALQTLIAQSERASSAMARLAGRSASDIQSLWQNAIARMRDDAARCLIERESWARDAKIINRVVALDPTDKREQCRAEVAELLAALQANSTAPPGAAAGSYNLSRALIEIASRIDLRGGSKKKWASEEDFNSARDALRDMREAIGGEKLLALEMNEADRAAAEVVARLTRLCERARARFAELKRARAALDFNDLEEIAERVLAHHAQVRERYSDANRGAIRALMIDEFQDTSPIQNRILWMIAPRSDELFIIGDAKQSIYRFRGADVTVFHNTMKEFASASDRRAAGEDFSQSQERAITSGDATALEDGFGPTSSSHRLITMAECFRAHSRLIDFVNHVFPSVFTRESDHDTPYEAMRAARLPAREGASVELHIITQGKEAEQRLSANEMREIEASLIARRIEEIIARADVTVCDERRGVRVAEYGDFALLFQASTNFDFYEQALAAARIPYVTIAGRGFYGRQEITDISNLLAFLVNPGDDLQLAGALRSPMFALSDETLLRLRLNSEAAINSRAERRSLWEALRSDDIELPQDEREAVGFAREALNSIRSIVGRVSPAEIIIAALSETGYLATLMALPSGERRAANIEKFIEQARALPSLTLSEMVERITNLKVREAREGEATIEEEGAVRLMTVHKSKGLEFPIVWLVDSTYSGGRDRAIVAAHCDIGITIDVKLDEGIYANEPLRPASFEAVKLAEARMDRAEKKRLLYVAATRARDHLIISGAAGRAKITGDHWMGRIACALGVDESDRPASIAYPGGHVAINWHDPYEIAAGAAV